MIGSNQLQDLNAWAECQKTAKPFPLEGGTSLDEIASLCGHGWHYHESIPTGYTVVDTCDLEDEAIFTECPHCQATAAHLGEEVFDPDSSSYLEALANAHDDQFYILLLDGEGFVLLVKPKKEES